MKSKNVSIRFFEEEMDFAKKKLGTDKIQTVIDHLLREFWRLYHPEVKEVVQEEIKPLKQPQYVQEEIKGFDYFFRQIRNLEEPEECNDFAAQVQVSPTLSSLEKRTLIDRLKAKFIQ